MNVVKKIDAEIDKFYAVTRDYVGLENDSTVVIVNNQDSTIEVKLRSQQYGSMYEFPNRGSASIIYIDKEANKTFRWDDETTKYYCTGSDYNQIKIIDGGKA